MLFFTFSTAVEGGAVSDSKPGAEPVADSDSKLRRGAACRLGIQAPAPEPVAEPDSKLRAEGP